MAKGKLSKSWAEQLADLEDPAPKDFDPEDQHEDVAADDASGSASDGDPAEAREHYVDVGKSELRKSNGTVVGPQYKGSSISREALFKDESDDDRFAKHIEQEESGSSEYADPEGDLEEGEQDEDEEIDSDEAFETGDDEKFGVFTFRGSKGTREDQNDSKSADPGHGLDQQEEDDALGNGKDENSGSYSLGGSKIARRSQEEGAGDAEDEENLHADEDTEASTDEFNGVDSDSVEKEDDESDIEMSDGEQFGDSDSDSENTSMSAEPDEPKADDRAALREMMAEEQKTVAASLYKAAKADVAKGRAIKHQRSTFDSLLNTRIKLQKALISTNSMSASRNNSPDDTETILAAESAALNLWNTISTLRSSLHPPSPNDTPFSATPTTPSPAIWKQMQYHESLSLPHRRTTLTKWSQRTNPITTLPRTSKFSQTPAQQPLTSVLDAHLTGSSAEKLLNRTRIPRSCAPMQAASHIPTDPHIYDDADFYTLLLRELVDQRMADSNAPTSTSSGGAMALPSQRDFKVKKVVDTKASKGRKMRYTVHEKLQNFMAPEDKGSWGERQRGELFSSLLGRKVVLGEGEDGDEGSGDEEMEGDGDGDEEGGLRLFG